MRQTPHVHHFIPATNPTRAALVLLHGSGGNEHDLVPLAGELVPGSPILSVRGNVAIDGGFAFFHRFPDRTIDEADITARTPILADFIEAASICYSFTRAPVAVGFSTCDHGGGAAPDPSQPVGGCHPVSSALTVCR